MTKYFNDTVGIAFVLILSLIIDWTFGDKAMYSFLVLVLISVLIYRSKEIENLIKSKEAN